MKKRVIFSSFSVLAASVFATGLNAGIKCQDSEFLADFDCVVSEKLITNSLPLVSTIAKPLRAVDPHSESIGLSSTATILIASSSAEKAPVTNSSTRSSGGSSVSSAGGPAVGSAVSSGKNESNSINSATNESVTNAGKEGDLRILHIVYFYKKY